MTSPTAINIAIAEALGLDPTRIRKGGVRITLDGDQGPIVEVEYRLNRLDADGALATELARYRLVPIPIPVLFEGTLSDLRWWSVERFNDGTHHERFDQRVRVVAVDKHATLIRAETAERGVPSVEIVQALLESENEVDALKAEVRRLLTLGQGQRTTDLLARYEALLEEHADCLTVAHQQESELERLQRGDFGA